MKRVGHLCEILAGSNELVEALRMSGCVTHYGAGAILFHSGERNEGVFLICDGVVRLRVPDIQRLDRLFSAGALLGLPSTFTGNPYALTATCLTDCNVVQVTGEKFLKLMNGRPELCRDATSILSGEAAFIYSAFRKRRRRAKSARRFTPGTQTKLGL
jgi:CRP-like cAMP-binding protein